MKGHEMKTTFVTTAALALALTAHADFKIDRSVMSEEYWKIWNDEAQAKIDAENICREAIKDGRLKEKEQMTAALREILEGMIGEGEPLSLNTTPSVILVIGVNGVGKTTSIGKIAAELKKQKKLLKMQTLNN